MPLPCRFKLRYLCFVIAAMTLQPAVAFEADVHFGLTKWLAIQAGFEASQAEAIAIGNQRVDGGTMDSQALTLEFGCTSPNVQIAREVQARHFPSAVQVPAPAGDRAVVPGGAAAREPLNQLLKHVAGKEVFMLVKLGEALHPLQDSWSHRGVPKAEPIAGIACNADLIAMADTGKGAHMADLTYPSIGQTLDMAETSYEALLAYPPIQGKVRHGKPWADLVAEVQGFGQQRTKTGKRQWFNRHGIEDTSFLEGISLPDGPDPGPLRWNGQYMPKLPRGESIQHDVAPDARDFMNQWLPRWLAGEPVDSLLQPSGDRRTHRQTPAANRQLAARLLLWRCVDHGRVSALAHAALPLTAAQLKTAEREAKSCRPPGSVFDAVYPLQPLKPDGAPLVPFILRELPQSVSASQGAPRFLAMIRLRHAPYDSLGLVIARSDSGWQVTDIVAAPGS